MGKRRGRSRLAQGNTACTHGDRAKVSTQLSQIAEKARKDCRARFTSLAHLLTPQFLMETRRGMNRRGASGVDGQSSKQFESELEERVHELWIRLRAGTYRAPPVRRVEIPKGTGKDGTGPLGSRRWRTVWCSERSPASWRPSSRWTSWTVKMERDILWETALAPCRAPCA